MPAHPERPPRTLLLTAIVLLALINGAGNAADYYFSATGDDNANTGLSASSPWQSIGKINSLALLPGDRVLLKRGDIWRGQIDVTQSGLAGQPITYSDWGTGPDNPLVLRTALPAWWQDSLADGGFESFNQDPVDTQNPDFAFPWVENRGTGAFVKADADAALVGRYAGRIERISPASSKPRLRMKKTLPKNTQFYVRFYSKTADLAQTPGSAPAILNVRVIDSRSSVPDRYWDPVTNSWTETPTSIYTSIGDDTYTAHSFTFTTDGATEFIDLRFEILNGTGIAWIDEVIVVSGSNEPTARIWTGSFPNAGKIFGMTENGQRVPTRKDISTQSSLNDGEFWFFNRFYYRKDAGVPVNAEVGRYMNAFRIHDEDPNTGAPLANGVHDIVIENIDVRGPGTRAPGLTRDREAGGGIFITPGSHDIIVRNLTASQTSTGVDAGIFRDDAGIFAGIPNPYGILYNNILSFDNASTGIYLRGSGTIRNCVTHDNGTLPLDDGDRGGIGLQEGPSIIEDNEIYDIGTGANLIDFAISACCYIGGQFVIRRNYIHDVANGGIQLDNRNLPAVDFGHLVEYNVIDRFGINYDPNALNHGQFAGLRIRNFQGNLIRNNLFANGGPHIRSRGVVLWEDVSNTRVHDNIFYNNQQADFRIVHNSIYSGLASDNNIFFRSDYTDAWWLESATPDSLSEWQLASGQDLNSSDTDPLFVDPANANYGLQPGSPAIDTGIDSGQSTDFINNPVLGTPDIGPNEFGHSDTDNDGLTDYQEICHNGDCRNYTPATASNPGGTDTDLNNPDTDADGYRDGTESAGGADPLDAGSIPQVGADGDINLDGNIDIVDTLLIYRYLLGFLSLTNEQRDHGDLYPPAGDGQLSLQDALLLTKLAVQP